MSMKNPWLCLFVVTIAGIQMAIGHDAKDFDDSVLYKIDFDIPDFDKNPEHREQVKRFATHDKEIYECVIPKLQDPKEEQPSNDPELLPLTLLQPIFTARSCSYRIEAYWSYEICHGQHVRQYHEEREGKTVKFQEYFLGRWDIEKASETIKNWEDSRKAGMKYKTTKIDNTKYPYFEMEMTDGTMCDIINAPRTTNVRYVCYPHAKNEIYSFKETSSCNYEAIILTSVLCVIPQFHPEESKEVSIKCYNPLAADATHKPLSMLRQELNEMQMFDDDLPLSNEVAMARKASNDRYMFLNQLGGDVDKLVLELMASAGVDIDTNASPLIGVGASGERTSGISSGAITDMSPIREFISGKNCLTGGTGWWKYEFCYGRHVRQFHKDKKSETELILGFFSDTAHRQWVTMNPDKGARRPGYATSIWHHYEKGTRCDRTGLPREVDVKLTCTPITNSADTVSMYLLEPKTCQYILVVESSIICDLIQMADEYGLVHEDRLQQLLQLESQGSSSVQSTPSSEQQEVEQKAEMPSDRNDRQQLIRDESVALPVVDVLA